MDNYLNVMNGQIIDGNFDYSAEIQKVPVSDEYYQLWESDSRKVMYKDGGIVENPDYEEIIRQEYETTWNEDFFETSLGWIRRKVTVQATGETRDFLYDMKPSLVVGAPIITYEKPNFPTEIEPIQHRGVPVTAQFLQECQNQIYKDFYGELPTEGE